jgi:hypothetical protein
MLMPVASASRQQPARDRGVADVNPVLVYL